MVRALANMPLADGVQIMSTNLGDPQYLGWVVFQNESPLSVDIDMGVIGHVVVPANYLWPIDTQDPAYDGWDGYATVIDPTQDLTIATGTNPGSYLRVHLFRPGEPCPITAPQPLNRSTNVGGGQVGTNVAYQLFESGNNSWFDAALESFGGGTVLQLRANGPLIASLGAALTYHIGNSGPADGLVIDANGQLTVVNKLISLNGEPAANGALGVPVVDGLTPAQHVTATTAQTILNFTPAVTGTYRISGYLRVNNGTSGNVLTCRFNFTDPDAGGSTTFFMRSDNGSSSQALNGVNSFANGAYSLAPYTFRHTGGQPITVTYTDPTNTPSDFFTVFVERVA